MSVWQCCGKGERFRILKVWVRPWVAIFFLFNRNTLKTATVYERGNLRPLFGLTVL